MDYAPILAQLQASLTGFKTVGSAADLDAIGNGVVPAPSCYLVPISESAEDNELVGGYEQRLTVGFSIVIVCANRRDATGAAALSGLDVLRSAVRAVLLAFAPDPALGEPCRFASGHLLRFDDGLLWWADEFRVTTYLRSV